MTATPSMRDLAQSPIQTAKAVLGRDPVDVSFTLKAGSVGLNNLASLFGAIGAVVDNQGNTRDIINLTEIGRYVANDLSNLLCCERETIEGHIQAAESGA